MIGKPTAKGLGLWKDEPLVPGAEPFKLNHRAAPTAVLRGGAAPSFKRVSARLTSHPIEGSSEGRGRPPEQGGVVTVVKIQLQLLQT